MAHRGRRHAHAGDELLARDGREPLTGRESRASGPESRPRSTPCARSGRSVDFLRSLARSWTATGSATWAGARAPEWARSRPASSTGSRRSTSSPAARRRSSEYIALAPPELRAELTICARQDGSFAVRRPRVALGALLPGRPRGRDRADPALRALAEREASRRTCAGTTRATCRARRPGPTRATGSAARPRLDEQPERSLVWQYFAIRGIERPRRPAPPGDAATRPVARIRGRRGAPGDQRRRLRPRRGNRLSGALPAGGRRPAGEHLVEGAGRRRRTTGSRAADGPSSPGKGANGDAFAKAMREVVA